MLNANICCSTLSCHTATLRRSFSTCGGGGGEWERCKPCASHHIGQENTGVVCFVLFLFLRLQQFFSRLQMAPYLTRRAFKSLPWRSCCFCFCLHASFIRRLTGAVVFCRVLLVQWNVNVTHLCVRVCVCGCIAQTCIPARWGSFRGSESVLLHVLGEVQLFTLQTGRMNSFVFFKTRRQFVLYPSSIFMWYMHFYFDRYFDLYFGIYFEFMRPSLIVCIILSSHLFLDIMWRKRLYVLQQRCYVYVPLKIKYEVWFFPVVSVFFYFW